jgi:hypothetical protein
MIDCHCHLYAPQFSAEEVVALSAEAAAAGVGAPRRRRPALLAPAAHRLRPAPLAPGAARAADPASPPLPPLPPAAIVTVPESLADAAVVLALSGANPLTAPCAGLHPVQPLHEGGAHYTGARCVAAADLPPALEFLRAHADKLVAVGEVRARPGRGWGGGVGRRGGCGSTGRGTPEPR